MMGIELWTGLLGSVFVVILGGVFWMLPVWSRPELFFAVTVPVNDSTRGPRAAVLGRFRRRVATVSAAALTGSLALVGAGQAPLVHLAMMGQLAGLFWAFLAARAAVLPLQVEPTGVREAILKPREMKLPGGIIGQAGPFLILGGLMVALAMAWDTLPARFVTHWNAAGEPDGWSTRSIVAVFGLPATGLSTVALMPILSWGLLHWARRVDIGGAAGEAETARRHAVAVALLGVSYFIALVFFPLGFMPLIRGPHEQRVFVGTTVAVAMLGALGLTTFLLAYLIPRFQTRQRAATAASPGEPPIGDRTSDRHWKLGLIYYNPGDPAVFLEKRFGLGYTLNFARPAAWLLLMGAVGLPLALTLAMMLLG
ncbi:MAG: DUF1648 domain-containing protein [Acidobacteriota bacterium]